MKAKIKKDMENWNWNSEEV